MHAHASHVDTWTMRVVCDAKEHQPMILDTVTVSTANV
jgi:hypothetical protein